MKKKMSPQIQKRLARFKESAEQQEKFERAVIHLDVPIFLWPEGNAKLFPKESLVGTGAERMPLPLLDEEFKMDLIELRIEAAKRGAAPPFDPVRAYFALSRYQERFAALPKGFRPKGKSSVRLTPSQSMRARIDDMKALLPVDEAVRRITTAAEAETYLLGEREKAGGEARRIQEELVRVSAELDRARHPEYLHDHHRLKQAGLTRELEESRAALHKEKTRNDFLEKEVNRLALQMVQTPPSAELIREDLESVRKEFALLSQKYDLLVSHNIELSNRMQRMNLARSLQDILDQIRERINSVLRVGVEQPDDVLLRSIQDEIGQLDRARNYLGRALFDLGKLHLRMGERTKALEQLRAARELGVSDPETNRMINQN